MRDFYEPASVGLWLLVTTISRKVGQLNFPLCALETAHGMDSEIVLLQDSCARQLQLELGGQPFR